MKNEENLHKTLGDLEVKMEDIKRMYVGLSQEDDFEPI